jgi:hypothetical protein
MKRKAKVIRKTKETNRTMETTQTSGTTKNQNSSVRSQTHKGTSLFSVASQPDVRTQKISQSDPV